jgi:hypothetical protein
MRSYRWPDFPGTPGMPYGVASKSQHNLSAPPDSFSASGEAVAGSGLKHAELVQEHRDLDGAITALYEAGTYDRFLIARLKKRKLWLKDEILRAASVAG